jgi:hypothetical protein
MIAPSMGIPPAAATRPTRRHGEAGANANQLIVVFFLPRNLDDVNDKPSHHPPIFNWASGHRDALDGMMGRVGALYY